MSTLDLIRSLRRTLAALREADSPVAVSRIARMLADELEAELRAHPDDDYDISLFASAPEVIDTR
jgi:hypothetical protein